MQKGEKLGRGDRINLAPQPAMTTSDSRIHYHISRSYDLSFTGDCAGDQPHRAELFAFAALDAQRFSGLRTRLDFEIGNGNEHSFRGDVRIRLPRIFCALAKRGGDGLRDTFDQRGFQNKSIFYGKRIGAKTNRPDGGGFRAIGQRVNETHRRAVRNQIFDGDGHDSVFNCGFGCAGDSGCSQNG